MLSKHLLIARISLLQMVSCSILCQKPLPLMVLCNIVSYDYSSPSYYAFLSSLSLVPVPRSVDEVLSYTEWHQVIEDEMSASVGNSMWSLISPPRKIYCWLMMGLCCESWCIWSGGQRKN